MLRIRNMMLGLAVAGFAGAAANANPIVQWTVGSGGNGHYYERIDQTGVTYAQAESDAAALTYSGLQGHLVVFEGATLADYLPEFNFVDTNVYAPGVTESRTYYVGADSSSGDHGTYTWVNGQSVPLAVDTTWLIDHNEAPPEAATFFQTGSHTLWDYSSGDSLGYSSGFIVEFEPASVPVPASSLAGLSLFSLMGLRRLRRRPITV